MFPGFSAALSALSADSNAIDVSGNNLANLNTPGYKSVEVEFYDLMSQNLGAAVNPAQVGMGVGPILTSSNYVQGGITNTNGPTDAAIEGDGFFVVRDASGQTLYTRDGGFQLDSSGNLITATGQMVQGWTAVNGTVNPNGPVGNLNVPLGTMIPGTETTTMNLNVNLDAGAPTSGTGSTFSTPIQVYDSLGSPHTLTVNFTKTGTNAWQYTVTLPSADLTAGSSAPLATGSLTFDGSGNLTSPAATDGPVAIAISGLSDGANDMTINWNLFDSSGNGNITQLSDTSTLEGDTQDGAAAGQINNVSLQNGGLLVASYSNGQQVTIGQLALASIQNPNSLISVGENNLKASAATAPPAVGAANTGARGQIVGGALEGSTSDMASEFTNLLTYERSYQAAARVITTGDTMLQDTLNMIQG
ncbi:MAG TPA: flagellar hook protein FlgE [Bryobacteraceae bacterium]|nr:flagellar hook protein FlgE [Bryobacteraceae bacterium]